MVDRRQIRKGKREIDPSSPSPMHPPWQRKPRAKPTRRLSDPRENPNPLIPLFNPTIIPRATSIPPKTKLCVSQWLAPILRGGPVAPWPTHLGVHISQMPSTEEKKVRTAQAFVRAGSRSGAKRPPSRSVSRDDDERSPSPSFTKPS